MIGFRLLHYRSTFRSCYGILSSLLLVGVLLTSCSPQNNRHVREVMVCAYNASHECLENQSTFPSATSDLMVTANIENVVEGTIIGVQWIYQEGELDSSVNIANTIFRKSDTSITSMYAILRQPDNGWPQGKYEVVLTSDESNVKSARQEFSIGTSNASGATRKTVKVSAVEPSESEAGSTSVAPTVSSETSSAALSNPIATLGKVIFCQLDDQGTCLTEMALLPADRPGVRVKANVSTAPVGTTVEARWRYVAGSWGSPEDIQTVSMTKKNAQDTWVQYNLKRPEKGWPTGQYEVALRIVPNASDIKVRRFFVR